MEEIHRVDGLAQELSVLNPILAHVEEHVGTLETNPPPPSMSLASLFEMPSLHRRSQHCRLSPPRLRRDHLRCFPSPPLAVSDPFPTQGFGHDHGGCVRAIWRPLGGWVHRARRRPDRWFQLHPHTTAASRIISASRASTS